MSIVLSWSVERRASGRPFSADEIERYELAMQVEGAPDYTPIPGPAPGDFEYVVDVNDPGTYGFRLVCIPKQGSASDPVSASATIADLTAPVILNFAATIQ